MLKPARKIYDWTCQKASSPFAPLWLGLAFVAELVFFLPLDALLVLFCLENPKKRYLYASAAACGSLIAGVMGYLIGLLLWDSVGPFVVGKVISEKFFQRLVDQYSLYEHWAVFLGSFLPIPFKAVSLSAGFCSIPLFPFVISVLLARSLRFLGIAFLIKRWGAQVKRFIEQHFHQILMVIGAKVLLIVFFFWILGH